MRDSRQQPNSSLRNRSYRTLLPALGIAMLLAAGCRSSEAVGAPRVDAEPLVLRSEQLTDPDDRAVVIALEYRARLQAFVAVGGSANGTRSVVPQWQSSDTSVVRIESADSVATLAYLAPGSATVTATYVGGDTTWRGAIRFRVTERTP